MSYLSINSIHRNVDNPTGPDFRANFQITVAGQPGFLQEFISRGQFGNNIGLGEPGFKKFHGFACKLAVMRMIFLLHLPVNPGCNSGCGCQQVCIFHCLFKLRRFTDSFCG